MAGFFFGWWCMLAVGCQVLAASRTESVELSAPIRCGVPHDVVAHPSVRELGHVLTTSSKKVSQEMSPWLEVHSTVKAVSAGNSKGRLVSFGMGGAPPPVLELVLSTMSGDMDSIDLVVGLVKYPGQKPKWLGTEGELVHGIPLCEGDESYNTADQFGVWVVNKDGSSCYSFFQRRGRLQYSLAEFTFQDEPHSRFYEPSELLRYNSEHDLVRQIQYLNKKSNEGARHPIAKQNSFMFLNYMIDIMTNREETLLFSHSEALTPDNRVRLTFFHNTLENGGVETNILNLCRDLDKSKFKLSLVAFEALGPLLSDFVEEGVEVVLLDLRLGDQVFESPDAARSTLDDSIINTEWNAHAIQILSNTDVLMSFWGGSSWIIGSIPVLLFHIPLHIVHMAWKLSLHPGWPVDVVWCPSKFVEKLQFVDHNTNMSVYSNVMIPLGVDFSSFVDSNIRPVLPKRQGKNLVVGRVSRVVTEKDPEAFVLTAAAVQKQDPSIRFVMVGGARNATVMSYLQETARRVGADIEFIGNVEFALIPSYFNAFDLFLYTPLSESFGLVTIQAMAMAVPVVTNGVGSLAEIVEGGGGIIAGTQYYSNRNPLENQVASYFHEEGREDSVAELAETILGLAKDHGYRRRIGQTAQQIAMDRYSLQAEIRTHEEFLPRALEMKLMCLWKLERDWRVHSVVH